MYDYDDTKMIIEIVQFFFFFAKFTRSKKDFLNTMFKTVITLI